MPDGIICTLLHYTVVCFSVVVVRCNFRIEASQEDALMRCPFHFVRAIELSNFQRTCIASAGRLIVNHHIKKT